MRNQTRIEAPVIDDLKEHIADKYGYKTSVPIPEYSTVDMPHYDELEAIPNIVLFSFADEHFQARLLSFDWVSTTARYSIQRLD